MKIKPTLRVSIGSANRTISFEELERFSKLLNLDAIAPGRISWLLIFDLLLWYELNGHNPSYISLQINVLEKTREVFGTKPPTQFQHPPLKGLWHKHFFDAHFIPHNLANHWAGNRLKNLVEEVLDPKKSSIITKEMISELNERLVEGAIEEREAAHKLTGEWIVYAEHEGRNYYLCLARHNEGDEAIFSRISQLCYLEFPFLKKE
jgi:hypothetical protein